MRKALLLIAFLFLCFNSFAQVGINNTSPQASLDISATNVATPANTDGILIPRIDDFPLTNPTAAQDGMLVFVTGAGVPAQGFYYWNNGTSSWVVFGGGANSLDQSYDQGGAGVGRIITADTGALEIQDTGGLRVEGNIFAAESIVHDGDANTFIGFTDDRLEIDAGGTNYMNIEHANSRVTFNDGSNELDFRIESGTNQNMFFVDGSTNRIGIGTNTPRNPFHIAMQTIFDTDVANTGQDGIFIIGSNTTGINEIGASISFGGAHPARANSRRAAIASMQTGFDEDSVGLAFYVHGGPINTEPMREGMRLTHNRRLGINNTNPSANLDVIGTLQYEDGNEATGYVLTSDATGNATWTDPTTIVNLVERIDDLIDGKSDNDGSEDGSSVFLGINSGAADDSSDNHNVGVGYQALEDNITGENNTGIGYLALTANQTGGQNTAVGQASLHTNVAGGGNTGIGYHALFATTGSNNTAVGNGTLGNNAVGEFNAALGTQALTFNTAGSNTAMGYRASYSNNAGTRNAAFGLQSLNFNISGNDNVAVGYRSGYTATGSGNVYLGSEAGNSAVGDNKLFIENTGANEDNALIYGEFGADATTTGNVLRTNGELQIGNPTGAGYAMPTADGTANQVLATDGGGQISWVAAGGITPSVARATMSGTVNVPVASWAVVPFDIESFDTNSEYDPTTYRFTAINAGYYRTNASFMHNGGGLPFSIGIFINGTLYSERPVRSSNTNPYTINNSTYLNVGDYLEIQAFNAGAGIMTLNATGIGNQFFFEIERID